MPIQTTTKKMIVFDIDGTLLGSNKKVLPSTLHSLVKLKEQGHQLFLATGRSLLFTKPVIQELGFENYILCNGAVGFVGHQQIFANPLDKEELTNFFKKTNQQRIDTAVVTLDNIHRTSAFDLEKMTNAMDAFGEPVPSYKEIDLQDEPVYQALAFYDQTIDHTFDHKFEKFSFIRWHEDSVDVVPHDGSKAATILEISQRLGFQNENIVSFGDGLNDREMLAHSGVGIAMGNAAAETKSCADLVTDTNDNDGIYKALKKLSLI